LRQHPEWSGFSFRSVPITHNLLSEIEAQMYGSDIERNMADHPWLKVLDQCLVVTRDGYRDAGGIEPEFGHFAEWLFAARLHRAGKTIGYHAGPAIHHYYVGDLRDLERSRWISPMAKSASPRCATAIRVERCFRRFRTSRSAAVDPTIRLEHGEVTLARAARQPRRLGSTSIAGDGCGFGVLVLACRRWNRGRGRVRARESCSAAGRLAMASADKPIARDLARPLSSRGFRVLCCSVE
jgi:hypothetical protein